LRWVFASELAWERTPSTIAEAAPLVGGSEAVVRLGEFMMILDLHRQGLSPTAIARRLGIDRKTVRKYIVRLALVIGTPEGAGWKKWVFPSDRSVLFMKARAMVIPSDISDYARKLRAYGG
jgi:Winged helix-turn helix